MPRFYFPVGLALLCASPLAAAHDQALTPNADQPTIATPDQPAGKLTLPAAIDMALQRNPDLAAARAEADAVAASIEQAGARPNPEVAVLMEDTRKSTRTTTWQLNQAIELGGKRSARIDAARRSHDIALLELAARRAQVRAGVTTAWFDALIAQDKLRLAQDLLHLSQRSSGMTQRRVAAGKLSPVEHARAGVADATARLAVSQAESELKLARIRLAAHWGASDGAWAISPGIAQALPPLPAIADLLRRVEEGPAARLAQMEVERRRALAQVERSRRLPDPTLSFGQKRDAEAGRTMWVVGVSMPLPLLDSNRGNHVESLKRIDKASEELAATQLRVRHDALQGHERWRQAELEAGALHGEILPAARSAYDAAARGFELGKFSYLDVLDAQRTYFLAQSQYWQALSTAHQAAAELDRLAGADLTDKE